MSLPKYNILYIVAKIAQETVLIDDMYCDSSYIKDRFRFNLEKWIKNVVKRLQNALNSAFLLQTCLSLNRIKDNLKRASTL